MRFIILLGFLVLNGCLIGHKGNETPKITITDPADGTTIGRDFRYTPTAMAGCESRYEEFEKSEGLFQLLITEVRSCQGEVLFLIDVSGTAKPAHHRALDWRCCQRAWRCDPSAPL